MIGGVSPETCWASYKYGIIKFWYIVASCEIYPTRPNRPGTHPTTCTIGTESLSEVKWPGRGVDNTSHLAQRLKKE
jgi:hypothetical protein